MNIDYLKVLGNYYESTTNFIHGNIFVESLNDIGKIFDYKIKPHIHTSLFQILIIEKSGGSCILNNEEFVFSDKALILIPNNVIHSFKWNTNIEGKVISINTNYFVSLFFNISDLYYFFDRPKFISKIPNNVFIRIHHLATNIFNELENNSIFADRIIKNMLEILIVNIYRDLASDKSIIIGKNLQSVKLYNEYRNLVIKNDQHRHDLGFFTKSLKVTLTKLNEACKLITGKPALSIITEQIVYDAKMLLIYSDLSISDIADRMHFSNQNYFARFFKRHTTMTPLEFRKKSLVDTNNS